MVALAFNLEEYACRNMLEEFKHARHHWSLLLWSVQGLWQKRDEVSRLSREKDGTSRLILCLKGRLNIGSETRLTSVPVLST